MTYLSLMPVFVQVGDLGLNTVGTNFITQEKSDNSVSIVYAAKIIAGSLGTVLFLIFCFVVPEYRDFPSLILSTAALVYLTCLLPNFYFVAFKHYHLVPIAPALHKAFYVLFVFVFISSLKSIDEVNFINVSALIIVFLLSFIFLKNELKGFSFSRGKKFIYEKRSSLKEVFSANILISIYVATPIVVLNLFETKEIVGLYGYAEKLTLGGKAFIGVFSGILFSKLSNQESLKKVFTSLYIPFVLGVTLTCLLTSLFSEKLLRILSAPVESSEYLKYVIWALVPIACNTIFYQYLLASSAYKQARNSVLVSTIASIFVITLGVQFGGASGVIYGILLSEIIFFSFVFLSFLRVKRHGK